MDKSMRNGDFLNLVKINFYRLYGSVRSSLTYVSIPWLLNSRWAGVGKGMANGKNKALRRG